MDNTKIQFARIFAHNLIFTGWSPSLAVARAIDAYQLSLGECTEIEIQLGLLD